MWPTGTSNHFDIGSVDDVNSIKQNTMFIVDEADLSLNSLISFDRATSLMNGLYYLKESQVNIYMTATVTGFM